MKLNEIPERWAGLMEKVSLVLGMLSFIAFERSKASCGMKTECEVAVSSHFKPVDFENYWS